MTHSPGLRSENGLPFCGISLEGKNWQELVRDINSRDSDMVVLGRHGVGRVAVSQLGTVTERLLRRVRRDIFICNRSMDENTSDEILVCLDGSPRSWGALKRGIALAKSFQKKVVAISCFDPYFHHAMFNAINKVMTEKAREVFNFEQQEKLHEDIIDSGLARIYQSHLDVARRIGEAEGVEISTQLLDGKACAKILQFIGKRSPWLVIMGRIGIHSDQDMDIGGNTENVCRLGTCNVLVVETEYNPPPEFLAEAAVTWTKEASRKMNMVPPMVRGVAMKAIQNHCVASGHTVVTTAVLKDAIKQLLPAEAIERMGITFDDERPQAKKFKKTLSLGFKCDACGHVHHGARPQQCPICGTDGKVLKLVESKSVPDGVAVGVLECADLERKGSDGGLVWTDAAIKRLDRVPEGFMRNAARKTVEDYATESGTREITLKVAENGLAQARGKMAGAMNTSPELKPSHKRQD